jgi:hypothetical protein
VIAVTDLSGLTPITGIGMAERLIRELIEKARKEVRKIIENPKVVKRRECRVCIDS